MKTEKKQARIFAAMSGTARKTRRWEREELITAAQAQAIVAFERDRQGRRFMRGLIGVGLFSIALGVLSIVASNWVHIPDGVKIGVHFLLNAAAAAGIWKADRDGNKWGREGATALFFGLNLTLIVLIGQVFQMSGSWAGALGLWMAVSSPALFVYGRTALNAVPWMAGLVAAVACVLFEIADHTSDLTGFLICLATVLFLPLLLLAAGADERLETLRPQWTAVCFRAAITALAVMASLSSLMWYEDMSHEMERLLSRAGSFETGYGLMAMICIAAPVAVYAYEHLTGKKETGDRGGIIFVIASLGASVAPLLLMSPGVDFLSAVHFIGYWSLIGWTGWKLGYERLVSLAMSFITLRIIIVYFELFGGLLSTGVGLIGGGVLILATVRGATELRKRIVNTYPRNGGDHDQ